MNITKLPYTYDIYLNDLTNLMTKYPLLKKEIIGHSALGKPLYAIHFGAGAKKTIITAAHHAKEWITSILVMSIVNSLCEEYTKGDVHFFRKHSVCFVPMVNPDGINLNINGITQDLPPYVKNRLMMILPKGDFCELWQANIRGIDLNHNYDASFSLGKALQLKEGIFAPSPTKYSGEYPESEPETKAIVALTKKISPDMVIAYHSQGEEIFYKYQGKCAPGAENIARRLSTASGYELIEAEGLTDCTGYKDWVIEKFNIPAFTVEVGRGENPLPLSQFDKIFEDNIKLIKAI